MPPLLAARDLSAAPPGATEPVLRGCSIELDPGTWLAVSGPNGCGKTTLALALAGLWPATRGTVELGGAPVRERRGEIAVVMQDPATQLLTGSVREELAYAARNLGRSEAEIARDVHEWSERLGLAESLERDPRALSAGGQQRLLLAAALISRPRVLIADEAAVHLDPSGREAILGLIRDQVARGLAVVWITQSESERVAADRTLELGPRPDPPRSGARARPDPSPAAIRLTIQPWDGLEGPAVRTARRLEIGIAARGVTALHGSNGSGKTVLLSTAAGLAKIPQCEVDWRIPRDPPPLVATQYPEQQIFEEKVEDELLFAPVSRGAPRDRALEEARRSLARMGFDPGDFLGKRCWWLSGGERRVVAVLAALLAPASLLALDEPTAGLDPGRASALLDLVAERAERGPVLVASQDLGWAESLGADVFQLGFEVGFGLPNLSKKMD